MKIVNREAILLSVILLVALLVRIWGVGYDLPYIYHAAEPRNVTISQNIFKTGDLNPHFFNYPSLFFYINSFAYIPYYLLGKFLAIFTTPGDILSPTSLAMGVTRSPMPTTILLGRLVTVAFSVGTVGLTFIIGKQLTGKVMVGLLAASLMAISPTNVSYGRLVTPDTFVVFFASASFLATALVYQQGRTWHYIVAGICIGLTASSKYNGGLILLPFLLAHFFRHGKTVLKERNLYLALLAAGFGFLATTPFAILDFPRFLGNLRFEGQHYGTGHVGMEGNTLRWYLNYMWQTAGIIYILAILEIMRGLYSRSKEIILLSTFPIVYFVFISNFVVRNDRTFLPLTPFLFLLAASFLVYLLSKAYGLQSKAMRQLSILGIVCLFVAGLVFPATKVLSDTIRLTTENSRETARVWISNNLPSESKIVIESYSPFVEPENFFVHGVGKMIDNKPEWYIEKGFDYLIFSQGMYGRFYREPELYSAEILQYDSFFNSFTLIKIFTDGDYEIRIYTTR
jgi:4-amino-4-deoxy-L-arabinose transferase-like glycosyltransferase